MRTRTKRQLLERRNKADDNDEELTHAMRRQKAYQRALGNHRAELRRLRAQLKNDDRVRFCGNSDREANAARRISAALEQIAQSGRALDEMREAL